MRIAIISDIHEDIESLRRVLRQIEKLGADRLVCLGDISGFSVPFYHYHADRNAHACLSLLREKHAIIVPGNHDYHAARMVPQHAPAFDFPANWYEMEYSERKTMANNEIWLHEENDLDPLYTSEDIRYLRTLPGYHVMNDAGKRGILFSHFVWPNMAGFVKSFYTEAKEFEPHFEFMAEQGCSISFTGHAHVRGWNMAIPRYFRYYRYGRRRLSAFPVCVGIPPVTRHKNRSGFCIFDAERSLLRVVRC
jgi:predicted phosphodiesterase